MRKSVLVLAAALAACFTLTGAEAAKRHAKPAAVPPDPIQQWNEKNMKPMAAPGVQPFAQPAAKPAKKAKKSKKKKAKKA